MSGPPSQNEPGTLPEPEPTATQCPVVGIGGSAGSLEAFTELLEHLPGDTGMSFVIIQHLDPQHHSILPELLSRRTRMPVAEVRENTPVVPNHVYIIPSNTSLTISQGILHLHTRPERGPHLTIDLFLSSLAQEMGGRAIGVILSGTASDGTQGLLAIKIAGGITFAQDESARFDAMPRSAVTAGVVDMVLPPAAIAREIARLCGHPYVRRAPVEEAAPETAPSMDFAGILSALRGATGVDFTLYKYGPLQRRILRRMALNRIETERDYLRVLKENRGELQSLFNDLLIKVTSFFREPGSFEALKKQVFPALFLDRPPGSPVRIWVPGCATGEEAYSLGIALLEFMRETGRDETVQIFGTDLSDAALDRARAGIYPESITADVSADRLRRFFTRAEGRYQISRTVRDMCIFARQNLAKDPPFSRLDLISCRNVMIYFGPVLQNKLVRLFSYALKPAGFLVLGQSEAVGPSSDLFRPVDRRLKIYARTQSTNHIADLEVRTYEDEHLPGHHERPRQAVSDQVRQRVDQYLLSRYSPAGVLIDEQGRVLQFNGPTGPYLKQAKARAGEMLASMLRDELAAEFVKVFEKVRKRPVPSKTGIIRITHLDHARNVRITVNPMVIPGAGEGQYLVVIVESPDLDKPGAKPERAEAKRPATARRVRELEDELEATRSYLESVIEEQQATTEELKSANEEVQSSNEELQSTNEELLTAKEELQSTNEELRTVNEEMNTRNAELTQVNNDLNNLLSSVNLPIVMVGNDLRIRRFTPQAERALNLLPTDVGRRITDFQPKIDVPDLEQLFIDAIQTLKVSEREVEDREGRWFSLWVRPYRTTDNKIDGAVMVLVDVTERKQTAEARYRRLFEAAKDGILLANADTGAVIDLNPFLATTFGVPRAASIGRRYWELPILAGTSLNEESYRELLRSETLFYGMPLVSPGGERFDVEVIGNVYAEADKRVIQLNIRDVTERKRLEEQARRTVEHVQQGNKMEAVGRLAGGVAHDFNNILTGIMGYADLLKSEFDLDEHAREAAEQIGRAAERASMLTKQLLAFGRKQIVRREVIDLRKVLAEMEQMIAVMLSGNIELDIRCDPDTRPVHADASQIEQVVINLVVNARDAMPGGGKVSVHIGNAHIDEGYAREHPSVPPGDYVCLSVSDTGVGMDEYVKEHMFEPFFTTKPKGKGTGLGLSTIYATVQQNSGYIAAMSELGRGTTFRIYLPSCEAEPVSAEPAQEHLSRLRGSETILVVDDEELVRKLTAQVMRQCGYRVLEATSGPDALRIASQHKDGPIHLLLTDVVMPQMSGRELADRLAPRYGLKVLYMSGHAEDAIVHHGVLEPGIEFINKPFTPVSLARRVRDILGPGLPDGGKDPEGAGSDGEAARTEAERTETARPEDAGGE